jgi:threonine-phosphate decarboxylase
VEKIHGGNIYETAKRHGLDPTKIIDFSASINPLGLSPKARKKILREGLSAILHYPDPDSSELRGALAQFHGVAEDQILAGAGSTEFIYTLPRLLKIRRPLIVTPAFSEYENALESSGESCRIYFFESKEDDGFELNVEGLMLALTQGYDALYLCNPNLGERLKSRGREIFPFAFQPSIPYTPRKIQKHCFWLFELGF